MITAKINCSKIDKAKLFKGEQGTYLDIVLIETPNGQYGDWMVCQATTKEERAAGKRGAILGNGKNIQAKGGNPKPAPRPTPAARPRPATNEDDVRY